MQIELTKEHGYVLAVILAFWIQQSIIYVIPVVKQRGATGIKAPTLYPRDSEIKEKKLTDKQVDDYMRVQRVHQNNVEFLVCFIPLLVIAAIANAEHAAYAGAFVWAGRMVSSMGYYVSADSRIYGE